MEVAKTPGLRKGSSETPRHDAEVSPLRGVSKHGGLSLALARPHHYLHPMVSPKRPSLALARPWAGPDLGRQKGGANGDSAPVTFVGPNRRRFDLHSPKVRGSRLRRPSEGRVTRDRNDSSRHDAS